MLVKVNPGSSFDYDGPRSPVLQTKVLGNRSTGSKEEYFKGFYDIHFGGLLQLCGFFSKRFLLPLGAWDGLRYFIVSLPWPSM